MPSDAHCHMVIFLRSRTMEKKAVVRIFIWYAQMKTGGSRFETATYCKLFCNT